MPPTDMNPAARSLLEQLVAKIGERAGRELQFVGLSREQCAELRIETEDARSGMLAIGTLLGDVNDPTARRAANRLIERLERAGLVKRVALGPGGARATHVELLAAGRAAVATAPGPKARKAKKAQAIAPATPTEGEAA